jgi:molecular chaperone DnaK
MKTDAATHADEDKKKREAVEEKNNAETLVYSAEKSLREYGDKVGEDVKKEVQERIEEVKKVKDGTDTAAIKTAVSALSQSLSKIGEAMAKAGAPNPEGQNTAEPKKEGETRDAKFEEGGEKA